jgi:hypothetical protein
VSAVIIGKTEWSPLPKLNDISSGSPRLGLASRAPSPQVDVLVRPFTLDPQELVLRHPIRALYFPANFPADVSPQAPHASRATTRSPHAQPQNPAHASVPRTSLLVRMQLAPPHTCFVQPHAPPLKLNPL